MFFFFVNRIAHPFDNDRNEIFDNVMLFDTLSNCHENTFHANKFICYS